MLEIPILPAPRTGADTLRGPQDSPGRPLSFLLILSLPLGERGPGLLPPRSLTAYNMRGCPVIPAPFGELCQAWGLGVAMGVTLPRGDSRYGRVTTGFFHCFLCCGLFLSGSNLISSLCFPNRQA